MHGDIGWLSEIGKGAFRPKVDPRGGAKNVSIHFPGISTNARRMDVRGS